MYLLLDNEPWQSTSVPVHTQRTLDALLSGTATSVHAATLDEKCFDVVALDVGELVDAIDDTTSHRDDSSGGDVLTEAGNAMMYFAHDAECSCVVDKLVIQSRKFSVVNCVVALVKTHCVLYYFLNELLFQIEMIDTYLKCAHVLSTQVSWFTLYTWLMCVGLFE
jgi:hypothetical protein